MINGAGAGEKRAPKAHEEREKRFDQEGTMAHAGQTLLPVECTYPHTKRLFQGEYAYEVAIRLFSLKIAKPTVFLPLARGLLADFARRPTMSNEASNDEAIRAQMRRKVAGSKNVKRIALEEFNDVKDDLLGGSLLGQETLKVLEAVEVPIITASAVVFSDRCFDAGQHLTSIDAAIFSQLPANVRAGVKKLIDMYDGASRCDKAPPRQR